MGNEDAKCGPPCREKYWSEIDAEEKCQRLRVEIKRQYRLIVEMMEILRKLSKHSHDAQGKPSVAIEPVYDGPGGPYPGKDDRDEEVYF